MVEDNQKVEIAVEQLDELGNVDVKRNGIVINIRDATDGEPMFDIDFRYCEPDNDFIILSDSVVHIDDPAFNNLLQYNFAEVKDLVEWTEYHLC